MIFDFINQRQMGVVSEVRKTDQNGTTIYLRSLSGANRMYPETDVNNIIITEEYLEHIRKNLPERLDVRKERMVKQYTISEDLAEQLTNYPSNANRFERFVKENPEIPHTLIARTCNFVDGKNDKCMDSLKDIVQTLQHDSIDKLLPYFNKIDFSEIEKEVQNVLLEKKEFIQERGMAAIGPLMKILMERIQNKITGKKLSDILESKISALIKEE